MAAGPVRFARNPGCHNRAGRAEIRYVIASAEHTGLKIANKVFTRGTGNPHIFFGLVCKIVNF